MSSARNKTLHYKRSNFVTQLPVDYSYTPSHAWLARVENSRWRVGLTKFASRMLGEMVDHGFEIEPGATVACGQVIGWVEGFKAISDVFCVAEGRFIHGNASLKERIALISKSPYDAGWLYEIDGQPDSRCIDVQTYRDVLDKTIERLLAQRKGAEIE